MNVPSATVRGVVRLLRDRLLAIGIVERLQRIAGPELLVPTYHRVLPPDHAEWATEQPGMLVTPDTLAMHLRVLSEHFEFVHLDDWVTACEARSVLPRLACAVTFDDGWRDNFEHAFPVLQQRGVPATIFLVTDLVGTQYSFWPNRLARALGALRRSGDLASWPPGLQHVLRPAGVAEALVRDQLSREVIDRAIERCKALADRELHALLDDVPQAVAPAGAGRDLLDWEEAATMQASGLVRFGSHTRRHIRMVSGIQDQDLRREVQGSAEILAGRLGCRPALFCYPNGDFTDRAVGVVAETYRAAVTTNTGWNTPETPPMFLHRVGMHEDVTHTTHGLLRRIERARTVRL